MAMGSLALNDWTTDQSCNYLDRVVGITDRYTCWARRIVNHPLWSGLPIEVREDFHERLMLGHTRGTIAHTLPRLP